MIKKNITVPKTARYFLLGEPGEKISTVWFVCHGYAQLASFFIKNFEVLNNGSNLVVACEGLHRFYWKGFDGNIVASWMTKEDREDDITDYVNYLDMVYADVLKLLSANVKINVIGFSQGGATVSRWFSKGKSKIDNLILWASVFPSDMDFELSKKIQTETKLTLVMGDKDEYTTAEQLKQHCDQLTKQNIKYTLIEFKGKHEITAEVLKKLCEL